MGKKRTRTKKISKGLRPTISKITMKLMIPDAGTRAMNKLHAWRNGKNPWMSVPNPNTNETNKPFIRVKADRYFGGTFKELKSRFKREREGSPQ